MFYRNIIHPVKHVFHKRTQGLGFRRHSPFSICGLMRLLEVAAVMECLQKMLLKTMQGNSLFCTMHNDATKLKEKPMVDNAFLPLNTPGMAKTQGQQAREITMTD